MIFKEITVERNFHIMNDDRFIMEKISATILVFDTDNENSAINMARDRIVSNFKAAYPNVYVHLNFDEETQVHDYGKAALPLPKDYIGNATIKFESIDQSFNLIDEINKCNRALLLKIYEPMVKTAEEKKVYNHRLRELEVTEKMYKEAVNQQKMPSK